MPSHTGRTKTWTIPGRRFRVHYSSYPYPSKYMDNNDWSVHSTHESRELAEREALRVLERNEGVRAVAVQATIHTYIRYTKGRERS